MNHLQYALAFVTQAAINTISVPPEPVVDDTIASYDSHDNTLRSISSETTQEITKFYTHITNSHDSTQTDNLCANAPKKSAIPVAYQPDSIDEISALCATLSLEPLAYTTCVLNCATINPVAALVLIGKHPELFALLTTITINNVSFAPLANNYSFESIVSAPSKEAVARALILIADKIKALATKNSIESIVNVIVDIPSLNYCSLHEATDIKSNKFSIHFAAEANDQIAYPLKATHNQLRWLILNRPLMDLDIDTATLVVHFIALTSPEQQYPCDPEYKKYGLENEKTRWGEEIPYDYSIKREDKTLPLHLPPAPRGIFDLSEVTLDPATFNALRALTTLDKKIYNANSSSIKTQNFIESITGGDHILTRGFAEYLQTIYTPCNSWQQQLMRFTNNHAHKLTIYDTYDYAFGSGELYLMCLFYPAVQELVYTNYKHSENTPHYRGMDYEIPIRLYNIVSLTLNNTMLSDKTLNTIIKLPLLRTITLNHCYIFDAKMHNTLTAEQIKSILLKRLGLISAINN